MKGFFKEPLAVEALVAAMLVGVLYFVVRGLKGVAGRISRRKALREFVRGVDAFFKGEFEDARDELLKVIERDPENSEARILLGDTYRELGDLAEAHKHHYQVASIFGQDLPRNRLSLGRDLLRLGKTCEALPHLERAHGADPGDRATAGLLLDGLVDEGRLTDAVNLSRRLAETAASPSEKERSRRRQAEVMARAGEEHLARGEFREAVQMFRGALRLDDGMVGPRLELVRSAYLSGSSAAAEKELLGQLKELTRLAERGQTLTRPRAVGGLPQRGESAPEAALSDGDVALPSPRAERALPEPRSDAGDGGAHALEQVEVNSPVQRRDELPPPVLKVDAGGVVRRLLPREAVYICSECGKGAVEFEDVCVDCGRFGTLVSVDLTPLAPVDGMEEILDEIQENKSYVRTLVHRAAEGESRAAARLTAMGRRIVPAVFREMVKVDDDRALVDLLAGLGPAAIEKILERYRRASGFSTKRLVREGRRAFRSLDGFVVRVLVGMEEDVVPHLDPLIDSGQKELRLIALDVLIRLGMAERIEEMRLAIPTKEMIERLNACPADELVPLLDHASEGGFLVEQVFTDRTFVGEVPLVRALERDGNRRKLRKVLMERGFSAGAYGAIEEVWGTEGVRAVVSDIVRAFGRSAADHLTGTCTNPDLPEAVREEALRLMLTFGDEEIERLTERLSEGDPETEKGLLIVIRAFGNRAVPSIVRSYGKTGLFQKVGLNRRRLQHRKVTLLRALREIGTYEAVQGLRSIYEKEGDADLKKRIASVLDRISGKERT